MVLPPQKSINNGLNFFDYNLYNNFNNEFNPYLKYSERYKNKMTFENTFYR